MSSVTVKIPTPLRPLTAGQSEVKIEGATVGEVLLKMDSQFKGFAGRIMDDGKTVKRFINVFVNEDNIRDKNELETELKAGGYDFDIAVNCGGELATDYADFTDGNIQWILMFPSVKSA